MSLQERRLGVSTLQVRKARHAAAKRRLVADLQIQDWEQILADFEYKCAYCGKDTPYPTIDHFLPLSLKEAGTQKKNCVPACLDYNRSKGALPPEVFLMKDPCKHLALRVYLANGSHPFWPLYALIKGGNCFFQPLNDL
jgi:hypothetical protein